jgi:hypothetical protein
MDTNRPPSSGLSSILANKILGQLRYCLRLDDFTSHLTLDILAKHTNKIA